MEFFKFQIGLSGTGELTEDWDMKVTSTESVRAVIQVLVDGMFNTVESDHLSDRYLKVLGANGSIQWASKKISRMRPDVATCELPMPFESEQG